MTDTAAGNYHPNEKDGTCGQYLGTGFVYPTNSRNTNTDNSLPVLLSSWNYGDKYAKY